MHGRYIFRKRNGGNGNDDVAREDVIEIMASADRMMVGEWKRVTINFKLPSLPRAVLYVCKSIDTKKR